MQKIFAAGVAFIYFPQGYFAALFLKSVSEDQDIPFVKKAKKAVSLSPESSPTFPYSLRRFKLFQIAGWNSFQLFY